MSYQTEQIQSMISEVDRVLRQTRRRKIWTIFTHHTLHRQALERCRNFLVMQQRPAPTAESKASMQLVPTANSASAGVDANLALELQRLRQEVMHPLRSDVAALGNQRTALQEEIQTLMFQKAQLQADCETLRLNLAQNSAPKTSHPLQPSMDEAELARLQALRDRTDFLLTSMDSSLHLAFGSMQKNVEVYQTTLHTGLDRMHYLGYQGEVLFSTLVNRLAQQVGRDMATALPNQQAPIETVSDRGFQSDRSETVESSTPISRTIPDAREETSAQLASLNEEQHPAEALNLSPMNQSIDFFFADFDETSSANSHLSERSSSLNLIPQQVDSISRSLSLGLEVPDHADEPSIDGDYLTINSLFDSSPELTDHAVEPEMTLAEMDDLFADVPSL